ncbi:hypothetical protein NMY22_g2268 [Coprinellus aureogranulatus]|nr:hypothetical protein NMY22_g2268 [Coprinellus aureogranulatus]
MQFFVAPVRLASVALVCLIAVSSVVAAPVPAQGIPESIIELEARRPASYLPITESRSSKGYLKFQSLSIPRTPVNASMDWRWKSFDAVNLPACDSYALKYKPTHSQLGRAFIPSTSSFSSTPFLLASVYQFNLGLPLSLPSQYRYAALHRSALARLSYDPSPPLVALDHFINLSPVAVSFVSLVHSAPTPSPEAVSEPDASNASRWRREVAGVRPSWRREESEESGNEKTTSRSNIYRVWSAVVPPNRVNRDPSFIVI